MPNFPETAHLGAIEIAILALANSSRIRQILRYLIVGGANTAFGYAVSVGIYYAFNPPLHIVVVGVLSNVICITEAFVAYKIFVFRSREGWLQEYLRSYLVYSTSAIIGIAGLWILVDQFGVRFWLAQACLTVIGVLISYVGHDRFTFRRREGR